MARPREFETNDVLEALKNVFWKNGYDGTSYADIMAATGLKKGSLYAAFGDKRTLYQKALAHYDAQHVKVGLTMLMDDTQTPRARVTTLFTGLVDAAETPEGKWGCLLCNAATEQSPIDTDIEACIKASLKKFKQGLNHCLSGTKAEPFTELLWSHYFGARMMVKAGFTKPDIRKLRDQALALLD